MSIHSEFSPSRLSRILACPGSVQACRGNQTTKSSKYAEEGTLLHLAMTKAMEGVPIDKHMLKPVILESEQLEALQDCYKYANELSQFTNTGVGIEKEVTLEGFGIPEIYGTCDIVMRMVNPDVIHIIDWKFGKGVPVYAEENDQLIAYALGAVEDAKFLNMYQEIWLHIAQPRLNTFSRWQLTQERANEWLDNARKAVLMASSKNAPIIPGEKQCRWCDVKQICPERLASAEKIAASVFAAHIEVRDNCVDEERLAQLMLQVPQLESYISDLQDYVKSRLLAGNEFPHFKMVEGRSTRVWLDEEVALKTLEEHLPLEQLYETKAKSLAKVEKELPAPERKAAWFVELIHKPHGAPTLVNELDKRPALSFQPFKDYIE